MRKIILRFHEEKNYFEGVDVVYIYPFRRMDRVVIFTDLSKINKNVKSKLIDYYPFLEEKINDTYFYENPKPDKVLKIADRFSKKYVIAFADNKYVNKFKKYGFKILSNKEFICFGGTLMGKEYEI